MVGALVGALVGVLVVGELVVGVLVGALVGVLVVGERVGALDGASVAKHARPPTLPAFESFPAGHLSHAAKVVAPASPMRNAVVAEPMSASVRARS